MKIEKITYQKTYSIGPYLTDRVGFEATLTQNQIPADGTIEIETPDLILSRLEKMADEWHRKSHPHLYQGDWKPGSDFPDHMKTEITFGPPPVIDLNQERMEIAIDNCMCEDELKQWKEANPVLPFPILRHYNKRMEELKNGME